jgi:hypothetical protein
MSLGGESQASEIVVGGKTLGGFKSLSHESVADLINNDKLVLKQSITSYANLQPIKTPWLCKTKLHKLSKCSEPRRATRNSNRKKFEKSIELFIKFLPIL